MIPIIECTFEILSKLNVTKEGSALMTLMSTIVIIDVIYYFFMNRYKLSHIKSNQGEKKKSNQGNFTEIFPYLHKVEYQIPSISSLQNIF